MRKIPTLAALALLVLPAHASAAPCLTGSVLKASIKPNGSLSATGTLNVRGERSVSLLSTITRAGRVEYVNDDGFTGAGLVGYEVTEVLPRSFAGMTFVVKVRFSTPCGTVSRAVSVRYPPMKERTQ